MTENKLQPNKRPKPFNKRWLLVIAGLLAVAMGVVTGILWTESQNVFLGLITIIGVAGGGLLAGKQAWGMVFHEKDAVIVGVDVNQGKTTGPVNCLNIYARTDPATKKNYAEKIVFENTPEPIGQPQQCLNDNKWYHVNIFDLGTMKLVPFGLPDALYTPPSLLARYIQIPAQRKYLRHREGWQKFVGPGILAVMNCIAFVAIIALAG